MSAASTPDEARTIYLANLKARLKARQRGEEPPTPSPVTLDRPVLGIEATPAALPGIAQEEPAEPARATEPSPVSAPTMVHPLAAELRAIVEAELSHDSIETLLLVARRLARAEGR